MIGEGIGADAAQTVATAATGAEQSLSRDITTAVAALADAATVIVGSVDRMTKLADDQATAYLAQITRLNDQIEKLLDKGLVFSLGK